MRKLFLLIPLLTFALMANAEEKIIGSTDPSVVNSDVLIAALQDANDGDVLILRDGIYNEHSNYIVFDKSVEVKAADGAKPVVEVECYIKVEGNKNVKIQGIKFDAEKQGPTGTITNTYSYFIRLYSVGTLELDGCEFCNTQSNRVIYAESTSHISYLKINDCYFHDGNNSAIYITQSSTAHVCDKLDITNSTFANYTGVSDALIRVNTKDGDFAPDAADDAELNVDHCTFYNFIKTTDDTYGFIDSRKSTKVAISNCIIVNPDVTGGAYAMATQTYGGTVSYCLDYGTKGHRITCSNRVNKDPFFVDAENGDYMLHGASPARTADENGAALGDPRWAKEIRPVINFSTPVVLAGIDATLANRIELDANYYLHQKNSDDATLHGTATWLFHADAPMNIQVTLNLSDATKSGHNYGVAIFDANDDAVGTPLNEGSQNEDVVDKNLSGIINLPAAGDYKVILSNSINWSGATIKGITLSYAGGVVQTLPCTMLPIDALRSSLAFINSNGELRFTDDSNYGHVTEQWAKWNIHAPKGGYYKFATSVASTNGQSYVVTIYNSNETVEKGSVSLPEAGNYGYARTFSTDLIYLEEGDYVIKVQNTTNYSYGRVVNIVATYEGGAVTALPGQIVGDDALLTGNIIRLENRDLKSSNTSSPTEEYAEWNVSFAAAGTMTIQLNLDPDQSSGHNYRVELYDGSELKGYAEESASTDPGTAFHSKGNVDLEQMITVPTAGNYIVKLVNRTEWSSMILHGITFAEYVPATAVTMNDEDAGTDAWSTYVDGDPVNVTVNRTILGGMFNPICLPFALTKNQVKAAFGNDVQWYYLNEASLENEVLDLQFAAAEDIYPGTPYLMKTSSNVTNPTFNGVVIKLTEASSTYHTGWPISFQGTFVQTTIDADGQNMLIYSNNQVGFPDSDKTLKGFRAYFRLTSASLAPSIKTARIITPNNTPTVIDLVNGQQSSAQSQKLLIDGRLIIVRDGVQYNVIGARVK